MSIIKKIKINNTEHDLAPSWEHVQDKPFYEELTEVLPLENLILAEEINADAICSTFASFSVVDQINEDDVCIVNYNGVSYECVAKNYYDELGEAMIVLGDLSLFGFGDGSEEPFGIGILSSDGSEPNLILLSWDIATSVNLSITKKHIKTLDYQYLPKPLQFGYVNGIKMTEVFPLTEITFNNPPIEKGTADVYLPYIHLLAGKMYEITINNETYRCEAKVFETENGPFVYFGSLTSHQEFPFAIASGYIVDKIQTFIQYYAPLTSTELAISMENETYETVKTKYLPEHLQFGKSDLKTLLFGPELISLEADENNFSIATLYSSFDLYKNNLYEVKINNECYECVAQEVLENGDRVLILGNPEEISNELPFAIIK